MACSQHLGFGSFSDSDLGAHSGKAMGNLAGQPVLVLNGIKLSSADKQIPFCTREFNFRVEQSSSVPRQTHRRIVCSDSSITKSHLTVLESWIPRMVWVGKDLKGSLNSPAHGWGWNYSIFKVFSNPNSSVTL